MNAAAAAITGGGVTSSVVVPMINDWALTEMVRYDHVRPGQKLNLINITNTATGTLFNEQQKLANDTNYKQAMHVVVILPQKAAIKKYYKNYCRPCYGDTSCQKQSNRIYYLSARLGGGSIAAAEEVDIGTRRSCGFPRTFITP